MELKYKKTVWLDDTKKPKPDEVIINGKTY
jgi:hypothetical protein